MPRRPGFFNLSTHFPWIGLRTNQPDGAHWNTSAASRIRSASRSAPALTREQLARWIEILDPERKPGRLTLIHRFGACRIADGLPPLIEAVRGEGGTGALDLRPDARQHADHLHRREDPQLRGHPSEVEQAFDSTASMASLGGIHIELTGENVTECIGGARGQSEEDLARAYESEVDPRLNYEQSLELAFLVAHKMKAELR